MSQFIGWGAGTHGTIPSAGVYDGLNSSCTGTAGSTTLNCSAALVAGDMVLIHNTQGSNYGEWEWNFITNVAGSVKTTLLPLSYTYSGSGSNRAQVVQAKQYTGGTVSGMISVNAWNGTIGGIIPLVATGRITISSTGNITTGGSGFRGGSRHISGLTGQSIPMQWGYTGEGTAGASFKASNDDANGNGAGAAGTGTDGNHSASGSGGNHAGGATASDASNGGRGGEIGQVVGNAELTNANFGGGGGGASYHGNGTAGTNGGNGGGLIFIFAREVINLGQIESNGNNGGYATGNGAGGGGAGGGVFIKAMSAAIGNTFAAAGLGQGINVPTIGNGGYGRIRVETCSTPTGISNPPASLSTGGYSFCSTGAINFIM